MEKKAQCSQQYRKLQSHATAGQVHRIVGYDIQNLPLVMASTKQAPPSKLPIIFHYIANILETKSLWECHTQRKEVKIYCPFVTYLHRNLQLLGEIRKIISWIGLVKNCLKETPIIH